MGAIRILLVTLLIFLANNLYAGYGSTLCKEPGYSCHKVKRGESWTRLFPGEDQRDLVKRINRMNTDIYSGMTIAIPDALDKDALDYSPLPREIDPPGKKTIIVDLNKLAFGAYDADGTLEHWGPVSGARGYCPDIHRSCHTATGHFTIYRKLGSECKSTKFPVGRGGAPMPYCMYYNGGFALHGSYEVPGYNASHGCVRLFVDDARWLNQDFTAGESTSVIVHN